MICIGSNPNEEFEALLLSPLALEGVLWPDEVKSILKIAESIELTEATVDGSVNREVRSCKSGWIPYTDENAWLYGRLYDLVNVANKNAFHFDPIDMVEPIMYVEYNEGDGYEWHVDLATPPPFSSRKLAITVQLSESVEYRGGSLEFANTPDYIYEVSREVGSVIIYPTYIAHRVQRVTQGKRKALVFWVGGTSFA